jgi:hypothetical protein
VETYKQIQMTQIIYHKKKDIPKKPSFTDWNKMYVFQFSDKEEKNLPSLDERINTWLKEESTIQTPIKFTHVFDIEGTKDFIHCDGIDKNRKWEPKDMDVIIYYGQKNGRDVFVGSKHDNASCQWRFLGHLNNGIV